MHTFVQKSVTDVSIGFRPPCWCLSGRAPAWHLHTNLYNFGLKNFSAYLAWEKLLWPESSRESIFTLILSFPWFLTLSIETSNSIHIGWKLRQFDLHFAQFVGDPLQMRRGPTGTDHRMLSVATGDYVAGWSVGYENQALSRLYLCCFLRTSEFRENVRVFELVCTSSFA